MTDLRSTIRELFARLEGDGEFGEVDSRAAFSVIAPRVAVGRLIFTTKSHIVPNTIANQPEYNSLGIVCRYGLPAETDLAWIRPLAAQHELYFLGDLDPVDLLVFAWLQDGLAPLPITHLGINDEYLSKLGIKIPPTYFLNCSPSEKQALPTLKMVLPDLEQIIGSISMQTLHSGHKLELEAIVSTLGGGENLLRPLH